MKKILILGAGTGGTIMANKLAANMEDNEWQITIIDQDEKHYYQPGFLFIPFGIYTKKDVIKEKKDYIPSDVNQILSAIELIKPEKNQVVLHNGTNLSYDYLIIATGSQIHPEETEGLKEKSWHKNIFDFYTIEGALALANHLKYWRGGRFIVNIAEMPIKCPVAPLEFIFLADWWFSEQGIRDKVDIKFVTPLSGAFTKPKATKYLDAFLEKKNIQILPEFNIWKVDNNSKKIISYDEQEVEYDLLISIPTNMGDNLIKRSNMGDEMNFVPTDRNTLRSKNHENIFVIGDATDLTSSKAGSVAHYQSNIIVDNIIRSIDKRPLNDEFDGHATCFIESGFGKGIMVDFSYDVEPLPGRFPLPGIGPFALLEESKMNHWGKMMYRWIYWNIMLKGSDFPIEEQLIMAGKKK